MTTISSGQFWIHTKTDRQYVTEGFCRMKHPATGDWLSAVIYRYIPPTPQAAPDIYCREREDFLAKFHVGAHPEHTSHDDD